MTVVRVLLVDDQPLVRTGLRMLLDSQADIEVIGESANGFEAIEMAHRLQPDVVLMDVRMPDMDGVTATRQLVEEGDSDPDQLVKVIILTTYHVDEAVYSALRAGASGFLLKDAEPDELIRARPRRSLRQGMARPAGSPPPVERFCSPPRQQHSPTRHIGAADASRAGGAHSYCPWVV